jgi:hypothetical protein
MRVRPSALAFGIGLALPLSAAAAVEPMQTFSAEYSVSFYGLTVARSTVVSSVGSKRYVIKSTIESTGLASFFSHTKAQTTASGQFDGAGVKPDTYTVSYVYGEKSKRTGLRFAKGNVVAVSNVPALPKRGADWVPIRSKDLRAVFDPLSAVLIPAKDASSVCSRTLKAFDGEIRANLALSYVSTGQDAIGGQQVEVVTCAARFQPVAGYRPTNKSLQYLSTKSRIVLKFAELGQTGLYAPVQASVSTKLGTFSIRARQVVAVQ